MQVNNMYFNFSNLREKRQFSLRVRLGRGISTKLVDIQSDKKKITGEE